MMGSLLPSAQMSCSEIAPATLGAGATAPASEPAAAAASLAVAVADAAPAVVTPAATDVDAETAPLVAPEAISAAAGGDVAAQCAVGVVGYEPQVSLAVSAHMGLHLVADATAHAAAPAGEPLLAPSAVVVIVGVAAGFAGCCQSWHWCILPMFHRHMLRPNPTNHQTYDLCRAAKVSADFHLCFPPSRGQLRGTI